MDTGRTNDDICRDIHDLLGETLYTQYLHFSFEEMAEVPELAEYCDELLRAAEDWQ